MFFVSPKNSSSVEMFIPTELRGPVVAIESRQPEISHGGQGQIAMTTERTHDPMLWSTIAIAALP